jgi:DNA-binding transcriptional LysR family regulator
MDSGDLRIFEAVARLGGMSRAATELNTVQSNVTARIRVLEDQLETSLFERHSRGVILTPAGRRLLPYAERIGSLIHEAARVVKDDATPQGPLLIGSLESTAAIHLSPLLTSYVSKWPKVDLVLRAGTSWELVQQVVARQLEGAFVCGPIDHPDLLAETIFAEELVVVTAPNVTQLAWLPGLADVRIVVLRASCSYRQKLEDLLARRGITGLRQLEFGTIEAVLGCVAAGLGVTMMPRRLVEAHRVADKVAMHEVPGDQSYVETQFIRRRDAYASSALEAFVTEARESLGGIGVPILRSA